MTDPTNDYHLRPPASDPSPQASREECLQAVRSFLGELALQQSKVQADERRRQLARHLLDR